MSTRSKKDRILNRTQQYIPPIKYSKTVLLFLVIFGVLLAMSLWTTLSQHSWGLRASYYTSADWTGKPKLTRIEHNPYLKGGVRENILSAAVFSVKWTGWIAIQQAGVYKFTTNSDDGSTIVLENTLLVDNGGAHGLRRKSQEIELDKGVYPIEIRYFQIGGYSVLQVLWTPPGQSERYIPHQRLFTEKPSWLSVKYRSMIVYVDNVLHITWRILGLSVLGVGLIGLSRKYILVRVMRAPMAVVFVGFLSVFCLQTFWKICPEPPLYGITVDASTPHFSLEAWFEGDFQRAAERWFNQHVGFRSFWVRTYNQISFSIFREVPPASSGTSVVLGGKNWLYTRKYLWEYAGYAWKITAEQAEERTQTLLRFQEQLARHHIAFLLIISPSKAHVYPEYMPRHYRARSKESAYDFTVSMLDKYGIHYLDAYKFFHDIKPKTPYRLFPKGGVHWSDYGAFLIFRESIVRLNQFLPTPLPVPAYDTITMAPPREPDNDLVQLLNIWTPQVIETSCPYLHFTTTPIPSENQPDVLIVGDSFVWHLTDFFSEQQLCTDIEMLFYYKHLITYPHKTQQRFNSKKADWKNLLLTKDIVLIEINQAFLHDEIGFGFVKDALDILENSSGF